jgi:hypothetical protein
MFSKHVVLYLLSCIALLISSCKNDLDVIDDYKETTIVYSLLNFKDTSQYIRIQKAFLGEGNAYLMAQHADSIYPDTSDFIITLQKISNGNAVDSFIRFSPATGLIKEEGLFTNFPHVIFKSIDNPLTSSKEDYIDKKASYKLILENKRTGIVVNATTPIVKDVVLDLTSPLLYPSSNINLAGVNPFKTEVTFPEFGKIMNLTVRFNYTEYTIGSTFFENKSLNYVLSDYVATNERGGQKFTYEISGEKFFSWLKTRISVNPALNRPATLVSLDFIFTIGAGEFYNYYSVSNSSALLNDVIPSYTNLSSGLGLVSSRVTSTYSGKKLTGESMDSLANGQFTGQLFN